MGAARDDSDERLSGSILRRHLAQHLHALTQLIRSRAVALYFQPFATVKLEKMAAAFGWGVDETEQEVVRLIGEGEVKGRVDRLGKVR